MCKKCSVINTEAEDIAQGKTQWEVADIFCLYADHYIKTYSPPASHTAVMHFITVCRTSYLGGHIEKCDACNYEDQSYNSCRNRHCPKCQAMTKAKWLQARMAELLPVIYFHTVFTLPHDLNPLVLCNKKALYTILFKAVSETLLAFGSNPKNRLGGTLGFIAILHTWTQTLLDHFHLHCLIPGGVLSFDRNSWIAVKNRKKQYLFPKHALSKTFRKLFTKHLQRAFKKGELQFHGDTSPLSDKKEFNRFIGKLRRIDWVVYSKEPFRGPEKTLQYLSRYTHRVAISNHRIINVQDDKVTFTYRDRKDGDKLKEMTLEANEFIRRFLLHVLPTGFVRIRYFGFLANRYRKDNLKRIRQLLDVSPELPHVQEKTTEELMLELTDIDITRCPKCNTGTMRVIAEIPDAWGRYLRGLKKASPYLDSS